MTRPPPKTAAASAPQNPLQDRQFWTLRCVRNALGRGGLPSAGTRSAEDHARIATFSALDGLLYLLDRFRGRVMQGERCALVVGEGGRERNKVTIVIEIASLP